MQAVLLLIVYLLTAAVVQTAGFFISQGVESIYPSLGLATFLIVFLAAFALAWPIAFWITTKILDRFGVEIQGQEKRAP